MDRYSQLKDMSLDGLVDVVNRYPWFGLARKFLCVRMQESGGNGWGMPGYSEAAMYVPTRSRIFALLRSEGVYSDKDVDSVLRLFPLLPERNINVVFTNAESRRALPASELEKHFIRLHGLSPEAVHLKTGGGKYSVVSIPSVADAVRTVLGTMAADEGAVVYIGGSTFVVAEALPLFI